MLKCFEKYTSKTRINCSSKRVNKFAQTLHFASVFSLSFLNSKYLMNYLMNYFWWIIISRPTSLHLTFLVVIQIWCLYLGDMRKKYVWCSTILWISTKFTCNKIIAWTHCSSHFSSQFHWSNMLILSMSKCTPCRNVLDL